MRACPECGSVLERDEYDVDICEECGWSSEEEGAFITAVYDDSEGGEEEKESKVIGKASFMGDPYFVHLTSYADGNIALILHPSRELYRSPDQVTVSVNLEGLAEGEVAIKDNDFYEGTLSLLLTAGVIDPPHRQQESGFVSYPVCRIAGKEGMSFDEARKTSVEKYGEVYKRLADS